MNGKPESGAMGGEPGWRILDPRRLEGVEAREQVEAGVRRYFRSRGFREVRTPLLVASPGMEPHIRPFEVRPLGQDRRAFLPTSPEFAMKRLLAGGLDKIFQICPAFRAEPRARTHHPEFTLLEFYRAESGYEAIMQDVEGLFAEVARGIHGRPRTHYQGRDIDLTPPWPRLRIRDLFRDAAGVDLVAASTLAKMTKECERLGLHAAQGDSWDDLTFKIWMDRIEPKLPADRAVFVHGYPPSQASLSNLETLDDGTQWAKRVEVYAGGLELGNGFDELTDPFEQRRRFEEDMALRERVYGASFPKSPLDEALLASLPSLPPSGGIAIGVDRMVMLMADEPEIEYTLWLPSAY